MTQKRNVLIVTTYKWNFRKIAMELDKPSLKNWRSHPFSAWAFRHVREIIPTAEVKNDPAKIWDLKFVKPPLQCETLAKVQNEIGLDALVISSGNSIVYEYYGNGAEADDQHILFSVSKSLLGLISDCLISDKIIRKDDKITDHLHELRGTAYDEATISQALDMRIDVDFDEDYTATEGPIIDYRYAANWNPTPEKMQNFNLKQFFKSLKTKNGLHGGNFHYISPNTDVLAWLFERASGRRYNELLSYYLWKPLGCERSAYITVDRSGGMRAAGGICATPRDLARVGLMLANNGKKDGQQIISKAWLADVYGSGDKEAWDKGSFKEFFGPRSMHYKSKWYVCHDQGKLLHGFGIHGQYLFVDPEKKMSIAWLSSEATALDKNSNNKILKFVDEIRNLLF